jgi:peptide/nickel transport system permease protein
MKALLRSPKALCGLAIFAVFTLAAVIGPYIAPYDPSLTSTAALQPPSWHHLLGTTQTGQDVFSQLLVGARVTMLVGFVAALISTALAVLVGVSAGYTGGATDEVLSMTSNIFLVIPALPLMIVLSAYLKSGGWLTVALVISIVGWAFGARVLRAQTLSIRQRDFIRSSRAMGERHWRIVLIEIMPNLSAVIVTTFLFSFIAAVLAQAGLAFLGLGSASEWSWGEMLFWAQNAQAFTLGAWWWYVPPGLCIALLGMGLTLINIGSDRIIDPRLAANRARPRSRNGAQPSTAARAGCQDLADGVVLEARELCVEYTSADGSPLRAVDEVTLSLQRGETLGLAGESGSGKSTLAYAATRLLRPAGVVTSGTVMLRRADGTSVDLLELSHEKLQALRWDELAVVFQSAMNALNPVRNIGSQLTDALAAHRPRMARSERTEVARRLLEAVGVPTERMTSFPHELSGGMRQRVMIAMSLLLDPAILVLDEPTTALDVVVQRGILTRLAELHERLGFSVLFITHDLSLLVEVADRIAVMYAGRIVESAPAAELYADPRHPYTQALLDSFPPLRGPRRALSEIPDRPPDLRDLGPGCPFAPRCPVAFETCTTVRPPLRSLPGGGDRRCACHLQDPDCAQVSVELRRAKGLHAVVGERR